MFFIILTGSMSDRSFVLNVAIISFSIIFPLGIYLSTLIYAVSKNSVGDVSKIDIKNWHIVEGYLFFMAMGWGANRCVNCLEGSGSNPCKPSR